MSKLAVEALATSTTTLIDTSYNSSKWNLGSLIKQRLDVTPSFIAPISNAVGRPAEVGVALANLGMYPWAMQWDVSNGVDWIFLADQTAAAVTRRIQLWTFNRNTSAFSWQGYTTLTPPQVGNHTIVGFEMTYQKYTKGQVTEASGTPTLINGWQSTVNTSTAWINDGMCVGSRIGFGSTDPTQISTWYTITNILQDSSMLITPPIPVGSTLNTSSNYVIEDLRAYIYTTSNTFNNSGLYVAKGLSYADFSASGSSPCVSCNTTVDSSKYVYRLSPYTINTSVNFMDCSAAGLAMEPMTNWQTQYAYGINLWGVTAGTPMRIFKYNVRAPLSILPGLGTSVSAISVSTGTMTATAATISRINNGVFAKPHTAGTNVAGLIDVSALYFVTLTKVNCIKTADIYENSTVGPVEMQEKPMGTVNLYPATGAFTSIEYASSIDKFIVMTSGATSFHSYITQFRTDLGNLDHIYLLDDKQIDQSSANPDNTTVTPHINTISLFQGPYETGGLMYVAGTGTTAITNIMHTATIGAEWTYSSSTNTIGRMITPKLLTPNCANFVRAYIVYDSILGTDIVGKRVDAVRMSYRLAGIDDNSGGWTPISEPNDLSSIGSATAIQFMVEFKCITEFCVPARVMVVGVVYNDTATDTHYRLSQVNSNVTTKTFAWRFATAWGTNASVNALKVILYDDILNSALVTDYTDTSTGSWQKSYDDANTWGAYDTADLGASNYTTYIRYIPTTLAPNTKVRAVLSLR